MRFAVFVKATADSEAGVMPSPEEFAKVQAWNEELVQAGVLLAAEGLQPSSKGMRVSFNDSKPTVIDGPFAETKEVIAGFSIIQAKSKDEILEWILRAGLVNGEVEIRKIFDAEDFAGILPAETLEREEQLNAHLDARLADAQKAGS